MDTSQYYAQLAPIYDPQLAFIQQQKTALPAQYEAQLSALEQAKINAYRDIGTAARERGMSFSGFSPEQQARYLGTTYLPAVANVRAQQTAGMTALDKAMIDLGTQRQGQALGLYREDLGYQRTAAENEKQRQFQREQSALDRAAGKYSSGSSTKSLTQAQILGAIAPNLMATAGSDGYVSPDSYKAAKQDAQRQGISSDEFDTYFGNLANPSHKSDYSSKFESTGTTTTTTTTQPTKKKNTWWNPFD